VKRLLALPLLALALAGCGSDSGNNEAASTNPSSTNTSSTNPSSPPQMQTIPDCMAAPDAGLDAKTSPAIENRETMYLTKVTVAADACTDQVFFDFEKQAPGPGFEVSYQPAETAKFEDGSGNPVEVDGNAFLVVKLTPAMTAKIDGDQLTKTYTGPKRLTLSGDTSVEDVVKTGDFESVVTWVIGLEEKKPFTTDASESQLVIHIERT
jgi:hypothetical protein